MEGAPQTKPNAKDSQKANSVNNADSGNRKVSGKSHISDNLDIR